MQRCAARTIDAATFLLKTFLLPKPRTAFSRRVSERAKEKFASLCSKNKTEPSFLGECSHLFFAKLTQLWSVHDVIAAARWRVMLL